MVSLPALRLSFYIELSISEISYAGSRSQPSKDTGMHLVHERAMSRQSRVCTIGLRSMMSDRNMVVSRCQEADMAKYRLRDASEYAQNIVNTVREPLVVLDDKFRVISTNRSFSSTFKVTPEMSENTMLFDLGNGQWDIPKLRELLEKVLPKSTSIEDFEVEHDFPAIGRKTMLLNARRIRSKTGATQILLAIEDITERKRAEEELQRINIELEEVLARETNVSQSLQAVFYPRIKQIEGYQFAARYRSVLEESELGGDNYDVFSLGGDETVLAIADVSGKGLRAAILGLSLIHISEPT